MTFSRQSPPLLARLKALAGANRSLLNNAGSMIGATLATSLLGVAFWFVAAQHFSESAVGVAGAAVSAMVLLGFVATLGLGTLMMGELGRPVAGRYALLNAALLTSLAVGALLGLCFALIAPLVSSNLGPLDATTIAAIFFAFGAGLTALGYVLDQAIIGLLRGGLQFGRNVIFASAKLLGLLVVAALVADPGAAWVYSAWGIGIAISMIVLLRVYPRNPEESLSPDFARLHRMRRSAASHAVVNLALETADLAMPIIVVTILSPTDNAGFYIAWLVVGFLVMVPFSLSSVAYAISSADADRIEGQFRFTFTVSLALGLLAVLILIPGAGPILSIFGAGYADTATTALRILSLGVFPLTVKTHYVAIHRVRHTLRRALPIAWMGTLLELGGGAIGATLGGISGVAWGWLAGLVIEALIMSRDVWQVCVPPLRRSRHPRPPAQAGRR
jgi:O-antigen/teichoic acid export membrane protein